MDSVGRTSSEATSSADELAAARALAAQRRVRRARTPWTSMVLSLAVVLGIVLMLFLLVPRVGSITQPSVNVTLGARAAAGNVDFVPSVPTGLPDTWKANSVRTTRASDQVMTWHAGFLIAGSEYAALEQGADATPRWLQEQTRGGEPDGTLSVAGQVWQRYTGGGGQRSLVHVRGQVTTVVTGTASLDNLALLAASLQPAG